MVRYMDKNHLSEEQFIETVMRRLPPIPDPRDEEATRQGIKGFYHDGWNVNDATAFSRCIEHVNPELEEAVALSRMAEIRSKYTKVQSTPNRG